MPLRKLYDAVMGAPFVYDRLRPFLLGGFDFSKVYEWLEAGPDDVVLDVGCGTGHALDHLGSFRAYHGFDPDTRALARFRATRPMDRVELHAREMTPDDVAALEPTRAVLMGLLHHLSDGEVAQLFTDLAASGRVRRLVTLDPVRVPGAHINNALCALDRGQHVRAEAGYRELVARSPFELAQSAFLTSNNGLARYFATLLVPGTTSNSR